MDKFKKFLKRHKKGIIVSIIILIILIAIAISMYKIIAFLMPDSKESVYGNRCETTEKYPVSSDREKTLKEFFEKYDKMTFKSIDVKCNLIDIIVEVDDSVNVSTIKTMSKELLKVFSTEETKFYDIQLLIKSNKKDSDTYPIIGTHHKEIDGSVNDHFVW